jgi:hypothetical protein
VIGLARSYLASIELCTMARVTMAQVVFARSISSLHDVALVPTALRSLQMRSCYLGLRSLGSETGTALEPRTCYVIVKWNELLPTFRFLFG